MGASVDTTSKVRLHALVYLLCLVIRLRMISGAHAKLCACQLEEQLPQLAGGDPITIRNDSDRQTMKLLDIIQKYSSHRSSRKGMTQWNKMCKLGEFIDDDHDDIC